MVLTPGPPASLPIYRSLTLPRQITDSRRVTENPAFRGLNVSIRRSCAAERVFLSITDSPIQLLFIIFIALWCVPDART